MFDDLKQWIARDIEPKRKQGWRIRLIEDVENELVCLITTQRYVFTVTAKPDWLGCTLRTRHITHDTDRYQFADLPDGKLNENTWNEIVNEIGQWEAVKQIQPFRGPA